MSSLMSGKAPSLNAIAGGALSAVMGNARDKIRDAGFDGFEPKPLNLKEFLGTVRRLAPV